MDKAHINDSSSASSCEDTHSVVSDNAQKDTCQAPSPNRGTPPLQAHAAMFLACLFWGLMAPLGKDAMSHGIDGITMVSFRVAGGAALFWLASLFTRKEHVSRKDVLRFAGAAVFGLVCN